MGLSQDEKNKLQVFSNMPLNRIQTETIIGRKLTDAEWESRNHDYLTNADGKVGIKIIVKYLLLLRDKLQTPH